MKGDVIINVSAILVVFLLMVALISISGDESKSKKEITELQTELAQCKSTNDALNELLDYYETKSMEEFANE